MRIFVQALYYVLILVLMEYGLWLGPVPKSADWIAGLNPCSNGIWSLTSLRTFNWPSSFGLNPCSNGIWSLTEAVRIPQGRRWVLILVLMEYGLWQEELDRWQRVWAVLILVLMEYGLWRGKQRAAVMWMLRLNPCSNGIWSLTKQSSFFIGVNSVS